MIGRVRRPRTDSVTSRVAFAALRARQHDRRVVSGYDLHHACACHNQKGGGARPRAENDANCRQATVARLSSRRPSRGWGDFSLPPPPESPVRAARLNAIAAARRRRDAVLEDVKQTWSLEKRQSSSPAVRRAPHRPPCLGRGLV